MSDFGISSVVPQIPAFIATAIRQQDATAQAAAINTVGAVTDQIASTLGSISSGLNIQV
jgi:hypothetical protein